MYIKRTLADPEFSNLCDFSSFPQLYSDMGTKFSLFGGNEIPKGADLHTYLTPGNNYYPQTATIGTLSNCPMNEAFRLKVTAPIANKNGSYILQEYTSFTGKSAAGVAYDPYNNVWGKPTEFVTKDDLNNAMRFIGNAVSFRVRSGSIGVKNMYFDMLDSSGNMASIGFISDGEKAITFAVGGTTVWEIPIS